MNSRTSEASSDSPEIRKIPMNDFGDSAPWNQKTNCPRLGDGLDTLVPLVGSVACSMCEFMAGTETGLVLCKYHRKNKKTPAGK